MHIEIMHAITSILLALHFLIRIQDTVSIVCNTASPEVLDKPGVLIKYTLSEISVRINYVKMYFSSRSMLSEIDKLSISYL